MSEVDVKATVEGVAARVEAGSSISDLSYRNYDGPLKTRFVRWWVVAQSGLRQMWGRGWFYIVPALVLCRFLMAGFLMYVQAQIASQVGTPLPNFTGEPEGQRFALKFWSVLCGDTNSMLLLIIALVAGAGSIAADNSANALLVYFSKPIGKIDYLVGKWMSVFLTLFGATLFPVALLYAYCLFSYREEGFFTSEPWLGPHLLVAALVPALIHSSVIIGISAWSKSPRIVAAIYTSVYVLSWALALYAHEVLYKGKPAMQSVIQYCSVRGLIISIDQYILHVVVQFNVLQRPPLDLVEIPKLWPLLTIAGVLIIGSLAAAWTRIRAVEVISG